MGVDSDNFLLLKILPVSEEFSWSPSSTKMLVYHKYYYAFCQIYLKDSIFAFEHQDLFCEVELI